MTRPDIPPLDAVQCDAIRTVLSRLQTLHRVEWPAIMAAEVRAAGDRYAVPEDYPRGGICTMSLHGVTAFGIDPVSMAETWATTARTALNAAALSAPLPGTAA
ncbi:hypothetical protein [Jannaschia sp. M317]|uniref:hypothetical protein n=1 Tax=Jannaschia sp. M317 TaxID=2867011 RepID=UPI0021A7E898|nr:hypothetical protein [Jannaschia sp. M317]UWQ16133.1 hypothetical protein K3551_09280 [Jannaschia sp. M317]